MKLVLLILFVLFLFIGLYCEEESVSYFSMFLCGLMFVLMI